MPPTSAARLRDVARRRATDPVRLLATAERHPERYDQRYYRHAGRHLCERFNRPRRDGQDENDALRGLLAEFHLASSQVDLAIAETDVALERRLSGRRPSHYTPPPLE